MNLYGFKIPEERTDLEELLSEIHKEIFPKGQEQIDEEIIPICDKLKDYSMSDVMNIYEHAIILLYCYWFLKKGQINAVDEMYFFSSVRGTFNLSRIQMLILYNFLKEKIQEIPIVEASDQSNVLFVKLHQLITGK